MSNRDALLRESRGLTMAEFPRPLVDFVARFNRGEFWESHEVLEDAWRENRSDFYQGLILYASALVHVQRGNPRGVLAQLAKTERRLAPYSPRYLGIDVAEILENSRVIESRLRSLPASARAQSLPRLPIPTLHLDPALIGGTESELHT